MSCEHKYLAAASTHCEFLLLATVRSQHQHERGLRDSRAQARFLDTVSISRTQVIHQPEVTVCILSELLLFAIENCLFLHSLQDKIGHNFFIEINVYSPFVIAQETFGERDMGTGTANPVIETGRKSDQFIFPNVQLHIPVQKKKSTHHRNHRNNSPNKKSPELHSCFENCEVYSSTSA